MKNGKPERRNRIRNRIADRRGMTMAELLVVVAIIGILGAAAVISVFAYQRNLAQLERDKIAREIFVAAQNHLTVARGENYQGRTDYGTEDTVTKDKDGKDIKGDYYFVVNGTMARGSVLDQMLPFGSIDETVRLGGSYIIRYQKDDGLVLDVFYCTPADTRFGHTLAAGDYETVMGMRDTDSVSNTDARRDWSGAVLGWYGGADALGLAEITLNPPDIEMVNAEKLYVRVKDNNAGKGKLRLLVQGEKSGKRHYLDIDLFNDVKDDDGFYRLVLDSVTTKFNGSFKDTHINDLWFDDMTGAKIPDANGLIPGEDIRVKAVAYSLDELSNIAYSGIRSANSLFAGVAYVGAANGDGVPNTAYIGNFRHLENLDKAISGLDANDVAKTGKVNGEINISQAHQITDLVWTGSNAADKGFCQSISGEVKIYQKGSDDVGTDSGAYYPIEPDYKLSYNGDRHRIVRVVTSAKSADAGLFGKTSGLAAVKNLQLLNFNINGADSAGALGGDLTGTVVTNVLARNTSDTAAVNVSSANAGGLVGRLRSGAIQFSAAALTVKGTANAGGLVGNAEGSGSETSVVTVSYAGGHTVSGGLYGKWVNGDSRGYDVRGGVAGGLIGDAGNTRITCSYSTCSVSGSTSGGFVGKSDGADIEGCYCTGLLKKPENSTKIRHAFLGSGTATLKGNHYFMNINKTKNDDGETVFIDPIRGGDDTGRKVKPLDTFNRTDKTYDEFVGKRWYRAHPYDSALKTYYKGKYNLRTVRQLCPPETTFPNGYTAWTDFFVNAHYGDWPVPEIFLINR